MSTDANILPNVIYSDTHVDINYKGHVSLLWNSFTSARWQHINTGFVNTGWQQKLVKYYGCKKFI